MTRSGLTTLIADDHTPKSQARYDGEEVRRGCWVEKACIASTL